MMTQNADKKREQIQLFYTDDMVPQDHLPRITDKTIDWSSIYKLIEDKYSQGNRRPSMDPVMLIKIPFIRYLYGIKSVRQTVKEVEVSVAYRRFLGLDMLDRMSHFSTFGKSYTRRFKDADPFEQIFTHILSECCKFRLVDPNEVFMDTTHVKTRVNNKKMQKRTIYDEALFFEDLSKQEINEDREAHGERPLKEEEDDNNTPSGRAGDGKEKTVRVSTSNPESGWFRKGEHKHVFVYAAQTTCDKNGWIFSYSVHSENNHDSRTFKSLYDKTKGIGVETLITDTGCKTPGMAKLLIGQGIKPLLPYRRPLTEESFFKKYGYVYGEYYDCYICPNNQMSTYRTTNRERYREYKSCGSAYAGCTYFVRRTQSRNHVKMIICHIWEPHMEMYEKIRQTLGMKELYS